jgi:hypothetical protein
MTACANQQNENDPSSNLPSVGTNLPNEQSYARAKAEFDLSSTPDGTAQFNLVKKSYAVAPNCLHGQCTDYTDITVTNLGSTQFELAQSQAQITQNTSNQNLSNIVDLKIATLFDNNLTSCGGQKCTSAAIRIYTTDSTGVQGAGLWSQAIGKSVPLTVSGGSSNSILASVPYFSAAGTPDNGTDLQIDLDPLAVDKNVLSLQMADFSDAAAPAGAGYTLSADFTQAGAGSYNAHVVVEYDLIGPPPPSPNPTQVVLESGNATLAYAGTMVESPNGTITIIDQDGSAMTKFTTKNGSTPTSTSLAAFMSTSSNYQSNNYLVTDASGNLYIGGGASLPQLVVITSSGTTKTQLGSTSGYWIEGAAIDSTGNFYALGSNGTNVVLYKVTTPLTSPTITSKTLSTNFQEAFGLTVDSSGNIDVLQGGSGSIYLNIYSPSFTQLKGPLVLPNSTLSFYNDIDGMTYAPGIGTGGTVFIVGADKLNNPAYWTVSNPLSASPVISSNIELATDAKSGTAASSVVVDSSNNVFISGASWNATKAGNVPTFWSISGGTVNSYQLETTTSGYAFGITVDSSGNVNVGVQEAGNLSLWTIPSWGL